MHGCELLERVAPAERKADPVIAHGEMKAIIRSKEPDFNRRSLSVLCRIGHGFGDQTECFLSERVRDQRAHISDLVINIDPPLVAETIAKIIEPPPEIKVRA